PNDRTDPFRLEGSARVAFTPQSPLGDWTVLDGGFRVSKTEAAFDGEFSLFPPAFPVQLGGRAAGYVNAQQLYLSAGGTFLLRDLQGRRVVSFASQVMLRVGSWEVDGRPQPLAELRAMVEICGAEARLLAEARDGLLRLAGAATPISVLGGVLTITGGGPEGGPAALLEVDHAGLRRFQLTGAVSLLGISSTAVEVAFDRELLRFALTHDFDIVGVHSHMALAVRWVPDRYLAGTSDFQVTLDLGEVLTALVRDVLRLPFPTLRIATGIRVEILELLVVEDSRKPDGTPLPDSGDRRLARHDQQVEAYRRRRAELHAQADAFLRDLADGIQQARRQRLEGERRLDAARADLRAAEARLGEAEAQAERARLVLVSEPADLALAEYQARLERAVAAAAATRAQVQALRSALAQEKGRFEAELKTVQARLDGIQDEMDALEEGRAYERLDALRSEQVRLKREKELYRRKLLSLADVQAEPAPRTADDDVVAARQAEESAAGSAGADPPPALDLLDRVWAATAEAHQLAAAEPRELPRVAVAEPMEDGPSRFLLRMRASFTFLGIPVTLPEMTFVRSNLGTLSTEDVLTRIPALLMDEVRQQTQSALRSAFASFADLGRFLVRLVFDADFRATVLGEEARSVDTGMSDTELSRFLDDLERHFPLPPELDEFRRRVHDAAREVERVLREGARAMETVARKVLSWLEWALNDIARLLG
ncbi:MAG TPA: hypothetical protein VFR37_18395, partial [Longimicrobium sp.]|nr:hypothetical protein [Longimicrobium sp.]